MINKKIAEAMGMEEPESDSPAYSVPMVQPHEIIISDNPILPDMKDINHRQLEGEKQLEDVIRSTLGYVKLLQDESASIDPKFRNRHIENTNTALGLALDAIKHKNELQLKKKDMRMKESKFDIDKKPGDTTNNIFMGNRESLIAILKGEDPEDSE